ncbi:UBP1-associated protein 2A-like [Alnus glutinosa]|uniref:UBP1-associated protein 2A-like n=1 Tax=Alnus glutinosa TaxID=3517 RepID=UPI002D77F94E|nr:UBP1-associated protein 2A-like [Alnus glutinosa]XP_062165901.1 UBP1-associated protein 2A-like [Alnus glutinosa]
MARKRKLGSKSAEATEPPKKQQQKEEDRTHFEAEEDQEDDEYVYEYEYEYEEDEEEEEEDEGEDEGEEEEEEDEEEEDEDPYKPQNADNQTANTSTSAAPATSRRDRDDEDDDDDPIQMVLEPFSKDQIINLLCEAVHKHPDVADRIQKVANEDPAHRKIFVHGLGWDTNTETLSNAFKQYGEIEDCKAVCDKVSGKSKGYGFIVFKTRSGARKALKQPQKKIGNRMTACQLASMFPAPQPSATAAAPTPPQSEYAQRKIYVSNVGAELDPQKLLTFFSKYGEIEEGPLGLNKMTGKPKGFCLFMYKTVESAKKALEEPHKNFEGHVLHCQKAIDGPKPHKSQHHQLQSQHLQYQHHQLQYQPHQNPHNGQFQRNENSILVGGASAAAPGHLMAPSAGAGIGLNQGAPAAQALNPALGQAIAALLASQGAGLGLTNLLGTLASAAAVNPGVPAAGHGTQGAYPNQANISPGLIGGYGNQGGMQGGYPNPQTQGGSGRGQHGVVQYGGVNPYTGQ